MSAQVPDPSTRASSALQRKLAAAQEEVARLRRDLAEARAELAESRDAEAEGLARETATGDILRVIASSPTDLGAVLDAVAENAARLCECDNVSIFRVEGERLRKAAEYGPLRGGAGVGEAIPITPETATGRAVLERRAVHLHDLLGEEGAEFPLARSAQADAGTRTILATPLLREGAPIGGIVLRRSEVRPFTEQQVKLLETFADQAVIAIENTRLFQELQDSNRELTEALEQQTATSEILRVIASSPADLQAVLDTVAENAARLCEANDGAVLRIEGNQLRRAANYGPMPARVGAEEVEGRRRRQPRRPAEQLVSDGIGVPRDRQESEPTRERWRTRGKLRARSKRRWSAVMHGQSSSTASARKDAS